MNRRRFFCYISDPDNVIRYISANNQKITIISTADFGSLILTNKYTQQGGIIIFDNPVQYIGDLIFSDQNSLISITIPNSVVSIGKEAFDFCIALTSITIPNNVTSIGYAAFRNCYSLESVIIGNGVITIEDDVFIGCSALTSILIPDSVESIGFGAFEDCSGLTSITIGNSVTKINSWAFMNCSSLNLIICKAVAPPAITGSTFENTSKSVSLYVPAESIDAYKAEVYWSEFTNIQAIP